MLLMNLGSNGFLLLGNHADKKVEHGGPRPGAAFVRVFFVPHGYTGYRSRVWP